MQNTGRWHGQPFLIPGDCHRRSDACLGQAKRATCPREFFFPCEASGITSGRRGPLFRAGELGRVEWWTIYGEPCWGDESQRATQRSWLRANKGAAPNGYLYPAFNKSEPPGVTIKRAFHFLLLLHKLLYALAHICTRICEATAHTNEDL